LNFRKRKRLRGISGMTCKMQEPSCTKKHRSRVMMTYLGFPLMIFNNIIFNDIIY
jgi:hypothetical protein